MALRQRSLVQQQVRLRQVAALGKLDAV